MRKSDGTPLGNLAWDTVKVGGMGFISGGEISADGTLIVARADAAGAYKRDATAGDTEWKLLTTPDRMTSPPVVSGALMGDAFGVYEIALCSNDPSVVYMTYRGHMFRSTDRGMTFTDDNINSGSPLYMPANSGHMRLTAHKLKVDPSNPNVAYFGAPQQGLWRRLSTGWANIASIPLSTETSDQYRATFIAIDPTSSTTGTSPNVRKSVVYVAHNGSGLYKSTDGGGTFSLLSGHPGAGSGFRANHLICDQLGRVWLVLYMATTKNMFYSDDHGATWTNANTSTGRTMYTVEVDPKNSNRVVAVCDLSPYQSLDRGATWPILYFPDGETSVSTRCYCIGPEIRAELLVGAAGIASIIPHPTENKDYVWGGFGVFNFKTPWRSYVAHNRTLEWVEDSAGIEELVTYSSFIHPLDGTTILSAGDRGVFKQNPDKTDFAKVNASVGHLTDGTTVDYAIDNPDFLGTHIYRDQENGGYSTDRGETWHQWPTMPVAARGGAVAVGNQNNIVYFPLMQRWPKYTLDGGTTWNDIICTGFARVADGADNGWGFGTPFDHFRHIVCADKTNPGTFWAFNYGASGFVTASQGIWKSTDGGVNWNKVGNPAWRGGQGLGYHASLIWVQGDLYINTGRQGSDYTEDADVRSYRSLDGGVTWIQITSINEPHHFAAGMARPGSGAPYSLYALGWIGGVFGLYRSEDKGVTWTTLNNDPFFPLCTNFSADMTEFGRLISGYVGSGWREANYNYKLRVKGS
jgi:xyloglucan-specific exo-beta-1,4-glucanase